MRVFAEKQSGAKNERAALVRCIASLEAGDTLLVTKLDRLARSTRDLLNSLAAVTERGASFRSLGDGWAGTSTAHGKLMVTVLGGLAEFERHLLFLRFFAIPGNQLGIVHGHFVVGKGAANAHLHTVEAELLGCRDGFNLTCHPQIPIGDTDLQALWRSGQASEYGKKSRSC